MPDTMTNIDPALGFMREFAKATHGVPALVDKLRKETIYKEGSVPIKYKVLAATLWAISARCEPCFKYYIGQAVKHGAIEAEVGEFLALGATMGGCVGEMWALKAFKAYKDIGMGKEAPNETCCHT